jgi:predicted nuclease with TOPRIM domain
MSARVIFSCAIVWLFMSGSLARADETQRLKDAYDDAIKQLQAAQDRKNELANENEQLKVRVAQLQQSLDDASARYTLLRDQTFRLRYDAAVLDQFLASDLKRWADWVRQFNRVPSPDREDRLLIDRDANWPFSAIDG